MIHKQSKNVARKKRHLRVRKTVKGTAERPRLNVYRSLKNIYVQLIDDVAGTTLLAASSQDKELGLAQGGNIEAAKAVGTLIAKRAVAKGLKAVVFDRGGFIYHGRVAALAAAAREAGLEF
ncbi:50S ribosomal protein L18 [Azotosporobacter soli]|uniref:50S ribosomal protein L18 n=1 Tax=Azotosporobacter soli TaxID=3055040 RepID=UPI0031FF2E60